MVQPVLAGHVPNTSPLQVYPAPSVDEQSVSSQQARPVGPTQLPTVTPLQVRLPQSEPTLQLLSEQLPNLGAFVGFATQVWLPLQSAVV